MYIFFSNLKFYEIFELHPFAKNDVQHFFRTTSRMNNGHVSPAD